MEQKEKYTPENGDVTYEGEPYILGLRGNQVPTFKWVFEQMQAQSRSIDRAIAIAKVAVGVAVVAVIVAIVL